MYSLEIMRTDSFIGQTAPVLVSTIKKDVEGLEIMQRRAANMVRGLKAEFYKEHMLSQKRKLKGDMAAKLQYLMGCYQKVV